MPTSTFLSLRARLLLLAILTVIPAIGFVLFTASEQRGQRETEINAATMGTAKLAANNLEHIFEGTRQVFSALSALPALYNHDTAACNAAFAAFKKQLPMYSNMAALKTNGDVICSSTPLQNRKINLADRLHVKIALQKKAFSFGEYALARITPTQMIGVAQPVIDDQQHVKALVVASIDLKWLAKQLDKITMPGDAALNVVDRNGTILYRHPDPGKWIGKNTSDSKLTKATLAQGEGVIVAEGVDGKTRLYAFTPVQGTDKGMYVRYGVSRSSAFADINLMLTRNVIALLIIACVAVAIAWFGGNYFVMRRIGTLMSATNELAKGNLRARVDAVDQEDEISHVGRSFNRMAAALERQREERRASEEKYRMLFEESKELVFISTPEGRYLDINPAGVELLGYSSKEEVFQLNISADVFADPEQRKAYTQLLAESGFVKDFELELKKKDGQTFTVLSTTTAVRNAKDDIVAYQGINHDITRRKQENEMLREGWERLDLALRSANMGVWYWDIINDRRGFDDQAFKLLGINSSTFTGTAAEYFGVVHPDDREKIRAALARTIEQNAPYESEYRVIWPDGSVHYITGRARLVRDEKGKPVRIHGIHWDITERKRVDEALRKSEERFKRLVQNSNDIIALLNENGIQTAISGPLERILGYKPDELIGKNVFDLVHPDDAETVKRIFTEGVRQPGANRMAEYRYQHKNGNWIAMEAVGTNLLQDPVVKAIVVNIRDISERNKLQEQLQQAMKMEAVGRLAGGVAHDFNNLLTVITGNIEMAKRGLNPSDPLAYYLNEVSKASDSAASLTQQLLAFSRRQIIEPKILNLNDLVSSIRQMLARLIGENIELQTILSEGLGPVKVDSGQFEQVLVNLAVNARDAMPDGGKLLIKTMNIYLDEDYCTHHPYVQPGKFVLLVVSDTGHGMSEEVKEHLFEPFFTTKATGRGTGLGLAMIFGVVKQAGGAIEVYSEVNHGTTFKIYLPRVEGQAQKLIKEGPALELPRGNETVLLVEDEESVRKVALMILTELGYKVLHAPNGGEALMLAEKHSEPIDLLMTDVVMPGINGRELAERLVRLHPEMKTLFSSGYTEDVIVHHGVVEVNLNFIGKPYSPQALAQKIREVLEKGNA